MEIARPCCAGVLPFEQPGSIQPAEYLACELSPEHPALELQALSGPLHVLRELCSGQPESILSCVPAVLTCRACSDIMCSQS